MRLKPDWILWLQLVYTTVLVVFWLCFMGSSPLDQDYASGEILDHFLAWGERGTLYAPLTEAPYRVLNYPPLVFLLVRALTLCGFAALTAGRAVNTLAMAGGLFLVYRWLRAAGCNRKHAAWSLGLLGSAVAPVYLAGQFHIQWLAVLLSLAGLYLLATNGRATVWAAALCALACFTKQTQLLSALVALVWLAQNDRRRLKVFGTAFLAVSATGWLACSLWFGAEMWRHLILYTVGTYSWGNLEGQFRVNVTPWSVLVIVAFWLGLRLSSSRRDLRWYYFCGTSLSLLSTCRAGASHQYFIEWSLALILWLGPQMGYWLYRPGIAVLLLLQLVNADYKSAWQMDIMGWRLVRNQKLVAQIGPYLPPGPGLILAEEPGVVRTFGRMPALQPFIIANLERRGLFDEEIVIRSLDARTYPVILFPFDVRKDWSSQCGDWNRWTTATLVAVARNYREVGRIDKWRILYPR